MPATITGYNRLGFAQAVVDRLTTDLVPGTLAHVDQDMGVRNMEQLHKALPDGKLPGTLFVDPPRGQREGISSGEMGRSPANGYQTDYAWALLGLAKLDRDETPHGVVVPIFEAIWESILDDDTFGTLVLGTFPTDTAHTGRTKGNRVAFSMGFNSPMEWFVE